MDPTSSGSDTASKSGKLPFGAGVDNASPRPGGAQGGDDRPRRKPRRRGGARRRGQKRRPEQDERGGQNSESQASGEGPAAPAEGETQARAQEPRAHESRNQEPRTQGSFKKQGRRRGGKHHGQGRGQGPQHGQAQGQGQAQGGRPSGAPAAQGEIEGMVVIEHANHAHVRLLENMYLPNKLDVHISPRLVQRYQLREGSVIKGPYARGQGRNKHELQDVDLVDGRSPNEARSIPAFKTLRSIDPDFHYEVGDPSGDTSLRVLDILCPVGRGQRGLIVAPPRSGKTILMRKFARALEQIYPEVHLIVLLVDERPEEATEWQRSVKGDVFVSTNDESPKNHVELAEAVWVRCKRLVELGEDVVVLLDSITRLARAYNHVKGSSGKTMSGGLDSHAMERPRQFFGSARNTETAGSLTILGTTLIETGSRMDQLIFEEFKGTGNMELVLSRKLADRRIFPAIDVERSGTRKEEKLLGKKRLPLVNTLRRVLARMHFAEAMELLITRLDNVEKLDDFLVRFEIDPEA